MLGGAPTANLQHPTLSATAQRFFSTLASRTNTKHAEIAPNSVSRGPEPGNCRMLTKRLSSTPCLRKRSYEPSASDSRMIRNSAKDTWESSKRAGRVHPAAPHQVAHQITHETRIHITKITKNGKIWSRNAPTRQVQGLKSRLGAVSSFPRLPGHI